MDLSITLCCFRILLALIATPEVLLAVRKIADLGFASKMLPKQPITIIFVILLALELHPTSQAC